MPAGRPTSGHYRLGTTALSSCWPPRSRDVPHDPHRHRTDEPTGSHHPGHVDHLCRVSLRRHPGRNLRAAQLHQRCELRPVHPIDSRTLTVDASQLALAVGLLLDELQLGEHVTRTCPPALLPPTHALLLSVVTLGSAGLSPSSVNSCHGGTDPASDPPQPQPHTATTTITPRSYCAHGLNDVSTKWPLIRPSPSTAGRGGAPGGSAHRRTAARSRTATPGNCPPSGRGSGHTHPSCRSEER